MHTVKGGVDLEKKRYSDPRWTQNPMSDSGRSVEEIAATLSDADRKELYELLGMCNEHFEEQRKEEEEEAKEKEEIKKK